MQRFRQSISLFTSTCMRSLGSAATLKSSLLFFCILFFNLTFSQTTNLLTQNFGSGTSFPAGWTAGGGASTFSVSTATSSSGYTGSSGNSNVLMLDVTPGTYTLIYDNSFSTLTYNYITVHWGGRRNSVSSPAINLYWSPDGTTWNAVTHTQVGTTGTWALVNSSTRIALPAGAGNIANLRLKWECVVSTSTSGFSYRLDDVTVEGSCIAPPVASAGTDGAACSQMTANWAAVSGATTYYLDVSTVSTFASFVTGYNNLNVGNVTTYNVNGLNCSATYYYRVRAGNACGYSGNSSTITYTSPAAPALSFFSSTTNYSTHDNTSGTGGSAPFGMVTADFNSDGYPDLATVNNTSNTISIFRNTCGAFNLSPTKTFTVTLSPATGSIAIATGDFDNDGDIDLAVANNTGAANNVSILRNDWIGLGTFTFTLVGNITVGATPALRGITAADLDGDGETDLAVTSNNSTNMYVLIGNTGAGDLTFTTIHTYTALNSGAGITAVDLDGDGDKDIITTHRNAVNQISIFTNNGTGATRFSATARIDYASATTDPMFVTTGLFDADTKPDLAVGYASNTTFRVILNTTASANTITLNNAGSVTYGTATQPICIAAADFGGDGKIDLATANFGSSSISVFTGDGLGAFSVMSPASFTVGTNPRWIVAADFNGDSKTDFAVPNQGNNNISVLLSSMPYTGTIDDKMNMIYSSASNHPHYGYSLVGMQDGGYLIAGKSQGWGNANAGISAGYSGYCNSLMKVDKNGALQWIRGYFMASDGNSNGETRHIIQSNDGHYIFCGKRNPWGGGAFMSVMKVTACGDTIWTKVFDQVTGSVGEIAMHIERAYTTGGADDGYIVVGNNSANEILLLKISESGTLQWSKKYAPWSVSEAKTVIPVDDNDADLYKDDGYLIAGYTNNASGSGSGKDALVMRTDASGNVSWAKAYGSNSNSGDDELYAAQQMYGDGQDFIVAGYTKSITGGGQQAALTLKIQTDGTQTTPGGWNNFMYTTNTIAYDVKIVDDTDGDSNPDDGFIIVGSMDNAGAAVQNAFVYNTAASGARLWVDSISVKKTTPTSQDDVFAVIQTKDFGYAAVGRTSYYGLDNIYLIKTTSAGILAGDLNICSSPNLSGVTVGTTNPTTWSGSTADTPSPLTYTVTTPMPSTLTTSTRIPSETEICVSNPLPIQLISFTANCLSEKQAIKLSWSTASEVNNNFFTVERSLDGKNFESAGYVNGAGNSNTAHNYTFTDDVEYISTLSPQVYYRLKQTDFDGRYEYFGPVFSNCSRDGFSLYPSLNSGTFYIQNPAAVPFSLKIFNLLGEVVYKKPLSEEEITKVDLSVPEGPYFAEIMTASKVISKKIIVNR